MYVMRMLFAVSVLLIASTVAGCAGGGPNPFTAPASNGSDSGYEDVRLTVENRDFRDATIYAYWNTSRRRVGFVVGKTSRTFQMRWLAEEVQLEVDFVGRGGFRSETMSVSPGDHLSFLIMPTQSVESASEVGNE